VILDLGAVDFLDSAGLGVLIGGMKRARLRGGSFDVVCGQDRTLRLLRISGVDKALEVYPDLASVFGAGPET
jgi:anti-sigma B factor antagonist